MKLNHFSNRALVWAFAYLVVMLGQMHGQTKLAPATTNESGIVRVLVAYHSLTANTEKMAEGVVEGVKRRPGVVVSLKKVDEVTKQDLESADGIILGGPTYYGTLPGTAVLARVVFSNREIFAP